MHPDYHGTLRLRIRRRVRRLYSAVELDNHFPFVLTQFRAFLQSEPLTGRLLRKLAEQHGDLPVSTALYLLCDDPHGDGHLAVLWKSFATEDTYAALCLAILERVCDGKLVAYATAQYGLGRKSPGNDWANGIRCFLIRFVEPLCDYLVEHLEAEAPQSPLPLLAKFRRFQRVCEGHGREDLCAVWQKEPAEAEGVFAAQLDEFLRGEGVDPVIAEFAVAAKVFSPGSGEDADPWSDLQKTFHALLEALGWAQQRLGYIVIFNTVGQRLHWIGSAASLGPFRYVAHDGRIVFFVIIDVSPPNAPPPAAEERTFILHECHYVKRAPAPPA